MTPDQLADCAAFLFGVDVRAIFGQARTHRAVAARQALAWTLRQQDWSLESIGTYLRRDHSTIHYGLEVAERLKDRNVSYAEKLAVLTAASAPPALGWQDRIEALERRVAQLETLLTERNGHAHGTEGPVQAGDQIGRREA